MLHTRRKESEGGKLMADDLVNITIDGHQVSVPQGTLLVEAAREIGLEIPVYCYHPKMKPVGACRVCLVEVEGQRKPLMTACTTTVMPDMVVHTKSEAAVTAREGIIEFLLINHPLDCPVCDRAGECDLQDFTLRYGPQNTRFVEKKRRFEKSISLGPNVILDRERCIMCQRCVRFCSEIAIEEGLVIIERGNRSEIGTFEGRPYDSKFSGNVIELCPVGALTAKTYRFRARPWEQQQFIGISNVDAFGTNITVDVRFDKVIRIRSRINDDIDDGWLTDETRYSHLPVHSEDRLTQPQIRNSDGKLEEATWEQAVAKITEAVSTEKKTTSGIVIGSKLSVEDGYAFLKLGRGVLDTPNVVHEFAHEQLPKNALPSGRIRGADSAEAIILLGCDPYETHPAFDLRIKKGLRAKAKLISLGSKPAMVGYSDFQALGEAPKLWSKLLKALKKESKDADEKALKLPTPRPWEAGGQTSEDWDELVETVRAASSVLVVVAGDLKEAGLQEVIGEVDSLGWATEPHGVLHLRSGVNSVGHDLLGLVPDGPQDPAESYKKAWGTYNNKKSRDLKALLDGGADVLFCVDSDPLSQKKAKKPKFLVAVATHPNATTEAADVVLPLASWIESNGVFVNLEGVAQFQRQAILPVGSSKPAFAIAGLLQTALGQPDTSLITSRDLYRELGTLNGSYAGVSYRDFLTPGTSHWSYPQQAGLGMPRPDLSAIPVDRPDTPMWMPAPLTGSNVERVSRLNHGEGVPPAPRQRDPREVAALLGLNYQGQFGVSQLPDSTAKPKEADVAVRLLPTPPAQPPGPTPANRYHDIGVGRRKQVAIPALAGAGLEAAENGEEPVEGADDNGSEENRGENK